MSGTDAEKQRAGQAGERSDTEREHAMTEEIGGTGPGRRAVSMRRIGLGCYEVTNPRGGTMTIGGGGATADFTPVELLLTAIGGCTASDVDHITSRRAQPDAFVVETTGEKVRSDEDGNHLTDLEVVFRVRFPEGADGDRAREMLPRAIARSHDRLCTVSRTVELGAAIRSRAEDG